MSNVIPLRTRQPDAYVMDVFGPDGLLAKHQPGYEMREGQVSLSREIARTLREGGRLLAEGPCGTGKSMAALVPAIYNAANANGKVLLVTATIALQEQYLHSELPRLAKILPWRFRYGLLKGRNNYACMDRDPTSAGLGGEDLKQFNAIVDWMDSPQCTGDKADLSFVPLDRVWRRFVVDSDDCKGDECQFKTRCHFERSRPDLKDPNNIPEVLVTNYHVLFADMALRQEYGVGILPDVFTSVICDEAHELADIAREFLGVTITRSTAMRMQRFAERECGWKKLPVARDREVLGDCASVFKQLESIAMQSLEAERARLGIEKSPLPSSWIFHLDRKDIVDTSSMREWVKTLSDRATNVTSALTSKKRNSSEGDWTEELSKRRAHSRSAARRFGKIAGWMREIFVDNNPSLACWLDLDLSTPQREVKIEARPVIVSELLATHLWSRFKSIVLMSATLTVGNPELSGWDHIVRETGLRDASTIAVPSPFDFENRVAVVVPAGMPEPTNKLWKESCTRIVREVTRQAGGRTLVLCSSKTHRDELFHNTAPSDPQWTWLRQGTMPASALVEKFRTDKRSVLFGTKTLWTGVDVPGDSCVCVVIDRIPFPTQDEPVIRKLRAHYGKRGFEMVDLPRALMQLRQGFGRLMRRTTDYGVVVILDSRITTSRWAPIAWASLPKTHRSPSLNEVGRWITSVESKDSKSISSTRGVATSETASTARASHTIETTKATREAT